MAFIVLEFLLRVTAIYFLISNMMYSVLLILSWFYLHDRKKNLAAVKKWIESSRHRKDLPPVSFVIPAFNEANVILSSLLGHLAINYENIQFIIVDDGSTDQTADLLIQKYEMSPSSLPKLRHTSAAKVGMIYHSKINPHLWLIRQQNSGKATALNTGLDYASGEYYFAVDADTVPEPDSVLYLMHAILESSEEIVAVGGAVRISNGAQFKGPLVDHGHLPKSLLLRFQVIEYIRAFYSGRSGWDWIQATLLLSGAMAGFKISALEEINGFDKDSITEDLEIILRLRWRALEKGHNWSVHLIPEPICWTQAPSSLKALRKQRIRWQQGLAQTLWKYFSLSLNPTYKNTGLLSLPYSLIFEWLGPWIELLSTLVVGAAFYYGFIDLFVVFTIFIIGLAYSLQVSFIAVHFEEHYFARSGSLASRIGFISGLLLENLGYRQLLWAFRMEAMTWAILQKPKWGSQTRHDISQETADQGDAA